MYSEPNPASFPNKPEDVKSFKEALCQTDSQTLESESRGSSESSERDMDIMKPSEANLPPLLGPLPEDIASFFNTVSAEGFPEDVPKAQPWKELLKRAHNPSPDGKLILACPKKCLYGTNNG